MVRQSANDSRRAVTILHARGPRGSLRASGSLVGPVGQSRVPEAGRAQRLFAFAARSRRQVRSAACAHRGVPEHVAGEAMATTDLTNDAPSVDILPPEPQARVRNALHPLPEDRDTARQQVAPAPLAGPFEHVDGRQQRARRHPIAARACDCAGSLHRTEDRIGDGARRATCH